MNKKLVLISLCIILSTAAANAGNSNVSPKTDCNSKQTAEGGVLRIEQPDYAYTLMDKIRKDRTTIYNALNLTPKQLECTRQIEKSRFEKIEPLIKDLVVEKRELKALECSNALKPTIMLKKHQIEKTTKEIKKISAQCDQKFEAILDREQTNKYEMIKKLRRQDLKKFQQMQTNGKKQGDLKPFGEKISQPAYKEQMQQENSFKNQCKKIFGK